VPLVTQSTSAEISGSCSVSGSGLTGSRATSRRRRYVCGEARRPAGPCVSAGRNSGVR